MKNLKILSSKLSAFEKSLLITAAFMLLVVVPAVLYLRNIAIEDEEFSFIVEIKLSKEWHIENGVNYYKDVTDFEIIDAYPVKVELIKEGESYAHLNVFVEDKKDIEKVVCSMKEKLMTQFKEEKEILKLQEKLSKKGC